MTLQRFDAVLNKLQKESPRVYDALVLLGKEVRFILDNAIITSVLDASLPSTIEQNPPEDIFKLIGWKRDSIFRAVFTADRLDKVSIGGASNPNGKLQVEEITNDHLNHEVLTLKRTRQDTISPLTNFGIDLSFRLAGFTVDTEPEAGRVQVLWENDQTNDTTTRDSTISLWNMVNNVLTRRFHISSAGVISLDATAYPSGRFVYTGTSGVLSTDPQILYDDTNDIVSFISSQISNPQLHIRQDSTGDAYVRISLVSARSFAVGIDNSDSDIFKISTNTSANAVPGTNDLFAISPAGDIGIGVGPSTSYKAQIDKAAGAQAAVLRLAQSDANTTPSLEISQGSTGDSSIRILLSGGASYALGIDNSDGDEFKISFGSAANAVLGTNDRLAIDSSGRFVINGSTFTSGRLVQLNHFEEGSWLWCDAAFLNPAFTMNNTASGGKQWQLISSATGGIKAGQFTIRDNTAGSNKFGIDTNGNLIFGPEAALATTATNGFIYIPSCAGTPTGVPTAVTGKIPLVYDSTNNILYAYSNGAWRAH